MGSIGAHVGEAHSGRRAHWLELFFDLVMVVYISQVAHTVHGDPSWPDALVFFAFLAAAWWAWVNATLTMNLFGARITPSIWITVTIAISAPEKRPLTTTSAKRTRSSVSMSGCRSWFSCHGQHETAFGRRGKGYVTTDRHARAEAER